METQLRRVIVEDTQRRGQQDEQGDPDHRGGAGADGQAETPWHCEYDQGEAAGEDAESAAARGRDEQARTHHDHRGRPGQRGWRASACSVDRERNAHHGEPRQQVCVPEVAIRPKRRVVGPLEPPLEARDGGAEHKGGDKPVPLTL